ncbi:hypothetical protein O7605_29585 [Verrucosispora sp. WMMA2121]|uniref:hypothetical protein n=1 Tax=Verrucosispora sp. WMMA2121 TaxID=3015164 RepID=UPI0022B69459|nr:hypothetical protein [Verrucosispora sp. WMMA2121]MCZ7423667.1 hypothetical protein [Verrucosispora sp. WMMA2121]
MNRYARSRVRGRTVRGLPAAAYCGFVLVFGVVLMVMAAERSYAFVAGVPGQVAVSDCHFESGGKRDGWACSGPFTADDGSVHIDRVHLRPLLYDRPVGVVEAKVAGPNATLAWEPDPWLLLPAGGGLILLMLSASVLWSTLRPDQDGPEAAENAELAEMRRQLAARRAELAQLREDLFPDSTPEPSRRWSR